ncbi:MAG: DUF2232 domain-containing protein [Proteobacteria bacterium]|nr:DUF2232 domain-containing protein [Pseudomonadota bacterium]
MLKGRKRDAGLWPRLLGFALFPLVVQLFEPSVGGILMILAPLPLSYGMTRRGIREGLAAILLVGILTGLAVGLDQSVFFLLETVPLCIGIRMVALSKIPLYQSVCLAVGFVVAVALTAFVLYGIGSGTGFGELYSQIVGRADLFMEGVVDNSSLGPEETKQLLWMVERFRSLFIGIEIATLIFLITFYGLLIRGWMAVAGLLGKEDLAFLSSWRLPFPFVLAFILLSFSVIVTSGPPRDIALNAFLPLGALYGIQGVIVAGHMFSKWELPSFFRALFLAMGILTFPMVFMIGIALLGLFDTWIDFRRRWPLPGPPAPPTT